MRLSPILSPCVLSPGCSNGPVTVVLTQEELRHLVAALENARQADAQELRDGLVQLITDDASNG